MRNIKSILKACALFAMVGCFAPGYKLLAGKDPVTGTHLLTIQDRFDGDYFIRVNTGEYCHDCHDDTYLVFSLNEEQGFVSRKEVISRQCSDLTFPRTVISSISPDNKPIIEMVLEACQDGTLSDVHPLITEGIQKLLQDLSAPSHRLPLPRPTFDCLNNIFILHTLIRAEITRDIWPAFPKMTIDLPKTPPQMPEALQDTKTDVDMSPLVEPAMKRPRTEAPQELTDIYTNEIDGGRLVLDHNDQTNTIRTNKPLDSIKK